MASGDGNLPVASGDGNVPVASGDGNLPVASGDGNLPVANGDGKSVLIVDDDAEVRHLLRLLFECEDFEVVGEAASGAEAIVLAIKHNPEFVVLDYMMPGMMGDNAATILRGLVPDTRIVAFSAVLNEKPTWADAFLNKDRIAEIAPFLSQLSSISERR